MWTPKQGFMPKPSQIAASSSAANAASTATPDTAAQATGASAGAGETAGAQTLRRGLAVLRLLTRTGPGGLRMGEVGRKLGLNKSTAIRLTRTLVDEGFVLHDQATGVYRLGPEAFAVGLAAEPSYALQRLAAPGLQALALESGDTVFFTVLHGVESICLSRSEGDFPIRNQLVKAGDRWPLGVGAGSCAMLAVLSDADVSNILARNAEQRAARYPGCDDAAIQRLIRQTRREGWCLNPGLVLESSWAIGVPVVDGHGRPVASISLAAIESRLGSPRRAALANRLMQASQALTALQADAEAAVRR